MELTTYPTSKLINTITDQILFLDTASGTVGDATLTVPTAPKNVSKHMTQIISIATLAVLKTNRAKLINLDLLANYGIEGKAAREGYRSVLRWLSKITIARNNKNYNLITITETREGIIATAEWRNVPGTKASTQPIPEDLSKIPAKLLAATMYLLRQASYHAGNHRITGQTIKLETLAPYLGYDAKKAVKHQDRFFDALYDLDRYMCGIGLAGLGVLKWQEVTMTYFLRNTKLQITISPGSDLNTALGFASKTTPTGKYTDGTESPYSHAALEAVAGEKILDFDNSLYIKMEKDFYRDKYLEEHPESHSIENNDDDFDVSKVVPF